MFQQIWTSPGRVNVICVDSYDDGVLKGRLYNPGLGMESFSSLSQFFLKMEAFLEQLQEPQSYTSPRTFSTFLQSERETVPVVNSRKGQRATFELKVIFRQHSSWQGVILWKEQKREHSFRSVLELVFLMDSALRSADAPEKFF